MLTGIKLQGFSCIKFSGVNIMETCHCIQHLHVSENTNLSLHTCLLWTLLTSPSLQSFIHIFNIIIETLKISLINVYNLINQNEINLSIIYVIVINVAPFIKHFKLVPYFTLWSFELRAITFWLLSVYPVKKVAYQTRKSKWFKKSKSGHKVWNLFLSNIQALRELGRQSRDNRNCKR